MKPITGVYVGWIPPEGKAWEPLFRTIRVAGGYQSDRTQLYAPTVERYPGLKRTLSFYPNPLELPFALERRTPLVREDYEWYARLLTLPYPNMDLFEFVGRTGGPMVADPLTICPLIEPNDAGIYTYEFSLKKVDCEVHDSLNERSQLQVITHHEAPTLVTADGRPLGELPAYFSSLKGEIANLTVVRTSDNHYFWGRVTLFSFETSVDLYSTPMFALASKEPIGV